MRKNSSQNFPASQIKGKLQEHVYRRQIHDVDQLKLRLIEEWGGLTKPSITIASVDRFHLNLVICLQLDTPLLVRNSVKI